jgi:hypothetical protein
MPAHMKFQMAQLGSILYVKSFSTVDYLDLKPDLTILQILPSGRRVPSYRPSILSLRHETSLHGYDQAVIAQM